MKYRLLGLLTGVLSLTLVAACGGSSSSPEGESETPVSEPGVEATVDGTPPSNTQLMSEGITQDPVAIVNGEEIPLSDLELQLSQLEVSYEQQGVPLPNGAELAQVQQQVLSRLIQQTLVLQESDARGITAEKEEIEAQYNQALATFPDEETFEETLASEGLTTEDVRSLLEQNIKIEKLLDAVIAEADVEAPTEAEVQELYDLASQRQDLPPIDDIRSQLEAELISQRENEVLQSFVQSLESSGDVEILLNS